MLGEPFVEREGVRFRKLDYYDRAEVLRRDAFRRREQFKRDMADLGVSDKGEILASLREFDAGDRKLVNEFYVLFDTDAGRADIIDLSLSDKKMIAPGQPAWTQRGDAPEAWNFVNLLTARQRLELIGEITCEEIEPEKNDDESSPPDDVYGEPAAADGEASEPANPTPPSATTKTTTA